MTAPPAGAAGPRTPGSDGAAADGPGQRVPGSGGSGTDGPGHRVPDAGGHGTGAGGRGPAGAGPARRALRWIHWYLRELTGESAYERYCARHRADHPGAPVPTPREYQRLLAARQEAAPRSRCC
ncbi:YbdD/YjiX family protein [Streptomyces sp. JNUCC 64]